jgi:hypothetical protein
VRTRSAWVAWSMLAIFAAGMGVGIPLMVANGEFQQGLAQQAALLLAFTAFMVVGAVVVAHRPGNAVGWMFSAIGLLAGTGVFGWQYAEYAYATRGGSLPGAILGAWYNNWFWYPTFSLAVVFTLLLFPTGRLLSPRWRPIALLAAATTAALAALSALAPTLTLGDQTRLRNPFGLAGIPNLEGSALGAALIGLFLVCTSAAVLSLVVRLRRSQGVERQQLKWLTYAGALAVLWLPLRDFLLPSGAVFDAVSGVTIALVPAAAGIAILRYRLYDIDRLINRTLVYGLLTAILGLVYAGAVLLLGQRFGRVRALPPSWAVAGATLATAALFRPARGRLQQAVDRRFDRRKYDAAKTVEAFSARLRDELDLDTLSAELLAVVDQTVQPTQAWLWLRPATERVRSAGWSGSSPWSSAHAGPSDSHGHRP